MRKSCCGQCKMYKKFKQPKISYVCDKTLLLSSICDQYGSGDENIFKSEESVEILKNFGLINNM